MHMKALVSKIEPRNTGYRVAQVEHDKNVFPVAANLEWINCPDNVIADQFWYDPADGSFKEYFIPVEISADQPTVNGAQVL